MFLIKKECTYVAGSRRGEVGDPIPDSIMCGDGIKRQVDSIYLNRVKTHISLEVIMGTRIVRQTHQSPMDFCTKWCQKLAPCAEKRSAKNTLNDTPSLCLGADRRHNSALEDKSRQEGIWFSPRRSPDSGRRLSFSRCRVRHIESNNRAARIFVAIRVRSRAEAFRTITENGTQLGLLWDEHVLTMNSNSLIPNLTRGLARIRKVWQLCSAHC